ncbi:MAG: C-terminal binding protein [Lachnospiraceae bacterium]|nr:C-terminal binding protein [Lachnospiraceae bacterium]
MNIVMFACSTTPCLDAWKSEFESAGGAGIVLDAGTDEEVLAACEGREVIVTLVTPLGADLIERLSTSVRRIVIAAMGCDLVDVEAARARGIEVFNVPGYAVEEVAVHQFALMLNLFRHVNNYSDFVKAGRWTSPDLAIDRPVRRLSCLTYGLIGFGQIARKVTEYASAFGMKVIAYDPYVPACEITASGAVAASSADEVLMAGDVISPNLPLTDETRHMISEREFGLMKDASYIVNTGRGAVVDTQSLIAALESGKIAGFAGDVFENEPFNDTDSPLMRMDNVILSPHIAYLSDESLHELISRTVRLAASGREDGQ